MRSKKNMNRKQAQPMQCEIFKHKKKQDQQIVFIV